MIRCMFFDTHVHFEHLGSEALAAVVSRALAAGVTRMVAVGASEAMNRAAEQAARSFPDSIRLALGQDREQAGKILDRSGRPSGRAVEDVMAGLKDQCVGLAKEGQALAPVALGEIGLDFHYHPEGVAPQVALFRGELAVARELGMPVIVHTREADRETLESLQEHTRGWKGDPARIGVIHCYTGGRDFARQLLDYGFFISFSGITTFRNADELRNVAAYVPLDRMLIETDTPYLAPIPMRGQENEPAFVPHVASKLAEIRHTRVEDIAACTYRNACALFGWA
jgi:TatD family hydrolase